MLGQTPNIFEIFRRDNPSSVIRLVNASAPLNAAGVLMSTRYMSKRRECQWALNCHAPISPVTLQKMATREKDTPRHAGRKKSCPQAQCGLTECVSAGSVHLIVAMTTRPVERRRPHCRETGTQPTINASPRCAVSEPNSPHGAESRSCQ